MKALTRTGLGIAVAIFSVPILNSAQAEPTTYEWETESNLLFSSNQAAIEAITGQAAAPIPTPVGLRYFVAGSMSGTFTYDPDIVDFTEQRGPFLAYNGPNRDWTSKLVSANNEVGTFSGAVSEVIVRDGDGAPGGPQDTVNVHMCGFPPCGFGVVSFSAGDWQASGSSVVFLGEGFQDGLGLPGALPGPGSATVLGIFSFFNAATGENVSILSREVDIREAALPVAIDIKPGSDPNCFSINGHGVIPVAILGAPDLDVTSIDQGSLSFGGLSVRVRGNKFPQCNVDYADADEYLDLVCHFEDDSSAWEEGGDTATLSGNLLDGSRIEGTDSICLKPSQ